MVCSPRSTKEGTVAAVGGKALYGTCTSRLAPGRHGLHSTFCHNLPVTMDRTQFKTCSSVPLSARTDASVPVWPLLTRPG